MMDAELKLGLTVPCPTCGRDAGNYCVFLTSGGAMVTDCHSARMDAVRRAEPETVQSLNGDDESTLRSTRFSPLTPDVIGRLIGRIVSIAIRGQRGEAVSTTVGRLQAVRRVENLNGSTHVGIEGGFGATWTDLNDVTITVIS